MAAHHPPDSTALDQDGGEIAVAIARGLER
jgi:hypothetical protein